MMIERKSYVEHLLKWKDMNMVKVITGVRRCGKSVILQQYMDKLSTLGVSQEQIIYINFESLKYEHLLTYQSLYQHIIDKCKNDLFYYLLFDEVQHVSEWEKAISSFRIDLYCDIYITGSNAYLLSSELATLLSGRSVSIQVLPLSFKEYISDMKNLPIQDAFQQYLQYGGFPGLLELPKDDQVRQEYLEGIYNTVIVKDVLNRTGITDTVLLTRLFTYMVAHIGSLTSANKIADFMNSNGSSTHVSTIIDYLNALEMAYILHKTNRFDIKGKKLLRSPDKYYICDIGIRSSILGFETLDIGRILENIVYLELLRRNYKVTVGAGMNTEIDFIANEGDSKRYYQVSLSAVDEKVLERELNSFRKINDQHSKILLTMDYGNRKNDEGIIFYNLIDWLLEV